MTIQELIVLLVSAAEAGQKDDAQAVRGKLADLGYTESSDLERYVTDRRFEPVLEAALLSDLRAALVPETAN